MRKAIKRERQIWRRRGATGEVLRQCVWLARKIRSGVRVRMRYAKWPTKIPFTSEGTERFAAEARALNAAA